MIQEKKIQQGLTKDNLPRETRRRDKMRQKETRREIGDEITLKRKKRD